MLDGLSVIAVVETAYYKAEKEFNLCEAERCLQNIRFAETGETDKMDL
ncbi:hypothetical protein JW935_21390 [candidate division KSB1 bacterium]|nr:hypothetical protein [candidate division KSB1 bacterium]